MADDFAKQVRELWTQAEDADGDNRKAALADLEFAAPDDATGHWDPRVREYREQMGIDKYGFPLPCLTINTLPQYIGQVVGDRRANATQIKVLPREDGDVKVAEVRSELIRSIQLQSKADRVFSQSFEQAVTCGIGNFRVDIDYAYEDAFERDLFIRGIPNPLAVRWDPLAADPTARDAGWCFVPDDILKEDYKRKYPDAAAPNIFDEDLKRTGWCDDSTVRVAEYWRIEERERTLAMMADGSVRDVTELPRKSWLGGAMRGSNGEPVVREKAKCKYAVMVLTNGMEELSDPFELKLHRLPIIRVTGREVWVGDKRVRFGLVRYARDPARLKDYWRSVVAEKLMLSPRANYIADAAAIAGRENDWPNTLVFNEGATPPVATSHQDLAAIINEAQMCAQDIKDTTGIHEASLGMGGNETSGIAIQRRQHEGDIATIIYHDNMNAAMQEAGEVCNALIPIVYDTARTIRTVGEDDAVKLLRVNDPAFQATAMVQDAIPDFAHGRYDVTISTGPAYMTKRQEAASSMLEAIRVDPTLMKIAGDKIALAQDWPGADEIAERYKRTIPPEILGDDANDDKSPEEMQRQQQAAQDAQQLKEQAMQMEMRLKEAEVSEAEGKARKANAEADLAESGVTTAIEGYNAETGRLKAVTAKDFPLPANAAAMLAPIVAQAIADALASPDVLEPQTDAGGGMDGRLPPDALAAAAEPNGGLPL